MFLRPQSPLSPSVRPQRMINTPRPHSFPQEIHQTSLLQNQCSQASGPIPARQANAGHQQVRLRPALQRSDAFNKRRYALDSRPNAEKGAQAIIEMLKDDNLRPDEIKFRLEHIIAKDRPDLNLPDTNGSYLAHWAARRGNVAVAAILAQPNLGVDFTKANKNGWTPLRLAVDDAQLGVLKAFLTNPNLDPNFVDEGPEGKLTALGVAVLNYASGPHDKTAKACLELLLKDKRVDPMILCKTNPNWGQTSENSARWYSTLSRPFRAFLSTKEISTENEAFSPDMIFVAPEGKSPFEAMLELPNQKVALPIIKLMMKNPNFRIEALPIAAQQTVQEKLNALQLL